MEFFRWDSHFVTGLQKTDDQHRHLVDIINNFSRLLTENAIHIDHVNVLYNELCDYAVYHFNEEVAFMKALKVDTRHLDHHIEMHRSFLEEATAIYSTVSSDNLENARTFLSFLIHWLAYHILGEDQDMANQITAIRSGLSPADAYEKLEYERARGTTTLLNALTGLFGQLSIQNKRLKLLNESLEEKVVERTQQLSEANVRLEELVLIDVLTSLPNRRHAMQSLSQLWDEAIQLGTPLVCMMIDADHFKIVNDAFGHDTGDAVLIELAKTLQHAIRNDDIVCRLGGDEFFIICPNTDIEGGMFLAEIVRQTVSTLRVPTGGTPWHGSISIGVASKMPDMTRYTDIIKAADKGVYIAKLAGKNCVKSFG